MRQAHEEAILAAARIHSETTGKECATRIIDVNHPGRAEFFRYEKGKVVEYILEGADIMSDEVFGRAKKIKPTITPTQAASST
jgi:hypothetical protein